MAHEPGTKFTQSEGILICGDVYGGKLPKTQNVENLFDIHNAGNRQTGCRNIFCLSVISLAPSVFIYFFQIMKSIGQL